MSDDSNPEFIDIYSLNTRSALLVYRLPNGDMQLRHTQRDKAGDHETVIKIPQKVCAWLAVRLNPKLENDLRRKRR